MNGIDLQWKLAGPENIFAAVANISQYMVVVGQQGAWRRIALNALDHAGVNYRIAYSCDHCAGQEAAMPADLAVTAFPKSLIRPPLKRLHNELLPPLGDYQVALVKRSGSGDASEVLAERVVEAFCEG